jgi:hypothetical protein
LHFLEAVDELRLGGVALEVEHLRGFAGQPLVSYPQLRNELNCSGAKEQGDGIPGVPLRPLSL